MAKTFQARYPSESEWTTIDPKTAEYPLRLPFEAAELYVEEDFTYSSSEKMWGTKDSHTVVTREVLKEGFGPEETWEVVIDFWPSFSAYQKDK